jgi:ketosteroid isomerase-like protein
LKKYISNRDIAQLIFTSLNKRDLTILENHLSENALFDFPGIGCIEGHRRIMLFLKVLLRKYPRLEFNVNEIIAEDDCVCLVWTNKGEDIKSNPYNNSGATIVKIKEEKIFFISDYFKDTSFAETK